MTRKHDRKKPSKQARLAARTPVGHADIARQVQDAIAAASSDGKVVVIQNLSITFNQNADGKAPKPEPKTRLGRAYRAFKKVAGSKAAGYVAALAIGTGSALLSTQDPAQAGYDARTQTAVTDAGYATASKLAERQGGPVAGVIVEQGGRVFSALFGHRDAPTTTPPAAAPTATPSVEPAAATPPAVPATGQGVQRQVAVRPSTPSGPAAP